MTEGRAPLRGSEVLRSLTTAIAPAMRAAGCTRAGGALGFHRQIAPELFTLAVGRSRPFEPAASFVLVNAEIGLARVPDARAGRFRRLSGVLGPGDARAALIAYRNQALARARSRDAPAIADGRVDPRFYEPLSESLPENYYADVWLPVGTQDASALAALLPELLLAAFSRVAHARIEGSRLLLDGE